MVQTTAFEARRVILASLPDALEILDLPARMVAYGFGTGYKDLICTIIPSQKGVRVGIAFGADLPDPDHVLEGSGKRHRTINFQTDGERKMKSLPGMLATAMTAWRRRGSRPDPSKRDRIAKTSTGTSAARGRNTDSTS